jgi:hypothetical protein
MLLSIAYKMDGDKLMAEKYAAISNIAMLRSSGKITALGANKNLQAPKSSDLIMHLKQLQALASQANLNLASDASQPLLAETTNAVESARAYADVRLTEGEKDELLIDLAEYLLKENFSQFADHTLKEIHDRENIRYLQCLAQI